MFSGCFRPDALVRERILHQARSDSQAAKRTPHPTSTVIRKAAPSAEPSRKTSSSSLGITSTPRSSSSRATSPTRSPPARKEPETSRRWASPSTIRRCPMSAARGSRFPGTSSRIRIPSDCSICRTCRSATIPDPTTCEAATTDNTDAILISKRPAWTRSQHTGLTCAWTGTRASRQRIFTRFSYDKLVFSTANVFPAPGGTPTML